MRLRRLLASFCLAALPAAAQEPLARFQNRNSTFHIMLPAGWRQVAPNEARAIGANVQAPAQLRLAQPRAFYAVGPVDRWLAGDFRGPWLYVVEGDHEWYLDDDFAADLAAMWRQWQEATGERHEVRDVRREKVGVQQIDVVTALADTTHPDGRPPVRSLDVHAPAAGRQLTLQFCSDPATFDAELANFRSWLATLTFARMPKPQASLGDRLWTPLIVGAGVGLVLLLLYRHTRARR